MNPSGAPSPIERFTSIVTHCAELDALGNTINPVVITSGSEVIVGNAKHIDNRTVASCAGRVNYELGSRTSCRLM